MIGKSSHSGAICYARHCPTPGRRSDRSQAGQMPPILAAHGAHSDACAVRAWRRRPDVATLLPSSDINRGARAARSGV
eukprot:2855152-Prymnesium_polylepis.1